MSQWKGSIATMSMVANQILERFGQEAVEKYDPQKNCFTYRAWQERGYQVKKGEKSLKSITFIEEKDSVGNVIRKHPRNVNLFFESQVDKK